MPVPGPTQCPYEHTDWKFSLASLGLLTMGCCLELGLGKGEACRPQPEHWTGQPTQRPHGPYPGDPTPSTRTPLCLHESHRAWGCWDRLLGRKQEPPSVGQEDLGEQG